MSTVAVKGWCPGAWQPMRSGDGLVVRIKPHGGRIDARQAAGIADLADRFGNGLIDLTNRANLQLRGVSEQTHPSVIDGLAEIGLLDPDPDIEARRNILVSPFWAADDDIASIAGELERALADDLAGLPAKFGFAVDCGNERVLADASADVRIERNVGGDLIMRADGAKFGRVVTHSEAVTAAIDLVRWFVASGGVNEGRGRMAPHLAAGATLPDTLGGEALPAQAKPRPGPGIMPHGALVGVALGQITHTALSWLAGRARGLRMTPWRMVLAEGVNDMLACDGLVARADDPILRVVACSGAPRCPEAHADTRALAERLAPYLAADARLHVSGCAKGCAQASPTSITLVAAAQGFDLVLDGSTRDLPTLRGLSSATILATPSIVSGGR